VKLHEAEVDIDAELVRALVDGRCEGEIREVCTTGTVNAIYRVGEGHYVRLPRVDDRDLHKEWEWLPWLAPRLPVRVPVPVHLGEPAHDYPFHWAIYEWIEGEPFHDRVDEARAARVLAAFVTALRALPQDDAPATGRAPLAELDLITRDAISDPAVLAAWEQALTAPEWDGEPTWIHCDLLRPNVLVEQGEIAAVIDFGAVGVGDPATDLTAAWAIFGPAGRAAFRDALDVDDGTWARGRGIALHQAAMIIPYYAQSNPEFARLAERTVAEVLTDCRNAAR